MSPTKTKKSKQQAVAEPPLDATQARILEILQKRDRMNVLQLAESLGEPIDKVRPILMSELTKLVGLTEETEEGEDDEEQPAVPQEVYLRLTSAEKARRSELESQVVSGQRQCATALVEIHASRLYRDFGTFESYVECCLHHSRQWAYEQMRWLEVMEALEAAELGDYQLGIGDATELYHLREHPSEYVNAIVEAEEKAKAEGVQRTRDHLRAAVKARQGFVQLAREFPDLSWEEYDALKSLPECDRRTEFRRAEDCLDAGYIPYDSVLLRKCRGQALVDLVAQLRPVAAALAELKELEQEEESVDTEAKADRKTIRERMEAVKRLASSDASTQTAPNASANGTTNVGLYDLACDGDGFDDPDDLPKPGLIMEEVIDFLRDWDGVLCNGDVAGDWAIVITPHRRDEESEDDETEDHETEADGSEDESSESDA
jgi:hypothetical protein